MATATVGILKVLLTMNSAEFVAATKRVSSAADGMTKDLKSIGQQATQIGSTLTKAITVPLVGLAAASVKAAIDFESSFANVAKTVDGVSDKSGKLTKEGSALAVTFRNMAKEIPKTTEELTAIAALGGQMGVPIKNLEKFTKNVAALGVAVDGIGAEEAASGLAQIANVFGDKEVRDIDKMSSALVHLGNSSNATEADILEFSKRLAGAGNAAGLTIPQVMALGTAMANVGLNAEAGGTAMSTMISKMSMAVSKGGDALDAFNKIVAFTGENFATIWKRSPIESIDAVVQGLGRAKANGEDLNLVVGQIGATNIRTADTMKRLAGAGDGVSASLKIANEGWAAGNKHLEEAEKKYATTANQLKLLWNQIKDVGITLGNSMLPAIRTTTAMISSLLPVLDMLAKGFAVMPGPLQAVFLGFGAMVAAAGPLIFIFGQILTSASTVTAAFTKKGIATRALSAAFNAFGGTASTALSWITRIGVAARASGLLFAGLSAAVVGIAVPVALAVISEHIRKINEELDRMIAASKIKGGPVTTPDEARRILTAQEAGAAGQPIKPKPFEPLTIDETNVWTKAKGAAESYEGQVLKVKIAQQDANAQFASTRNLTIEQVQALAKASGAAKDYAGGVLQMGTASKAAAGASNALKDAQKEIAEANEKYAKELIGIKDALRLQILSMDQTGKSTKDLAGQYHISQDTVERFKKELEGTSKVLKKSGEDVARFKEEVKDLNAAITSRGDLTQSALLARFGEDSQKAIERAKDLSLSLDTIPPKVRALGDAQALKDLKAAIDSVPPAVVGIADVLSELDKQMEATTGRSNKGWVDLREGLIDAQQRMLDVVKTGTAARLAVIDSAEKKEIESFASLRVNDEQMYRERLAITKAFYQHQRDIANGTADTIVERMRAAGVMTRKDLRDTAFAAVRDYEQMKQSGQFSALAVREAWERANVALRAAGMQTLHTYTDIFKAIGLQAAGAFSEGGLEGLAHFGQQFVTDFASEMLSFLPGGKFISQFAKPIIDWATKSLGKWFGRGDDGDKQRDEFLKQMGGYQALAQRLHDTLGSAGDRLFKNLQNANSGKQAAAAIDAITAALDRADKESAAFNASLGASLQKIQALGGGIPAAIRPLLDGLREGKKLTQENIDLLNELASSGDADWRKIAERVQAYGGDIEKLGGSFQAARLHDAWQEIIDDIDLFTRGGINANDILDLTDDKINELVQQSQRFGTEIPENMRPWIQRLIDSGKLLDENGDKIEDIGSLTFGETLQTSIQKLTDEIKLLIAQLDKVPGAVRGIPRDIDTTVTVRRRVIDEREGSGDFEGDTIAASTGGIVGRGRMQFLDQGGIAGSISRVFSHVWKPRGTDTQPAMLTPGEVVLNEAQQGMVGSTLQQAMQFVDSLKRDFSAANPVIARPEGGGNTQQVNNNISVGSVRDLEHARELGRQIGRELRRGGELLDTWKRDAMPALTGGR